jgi:bifunctional DNA-binding transcriptional regulator/antitoxin component of YhaV-PrlF toxin-antitoxin module
VVIPKEMREELGIPEGGELRLTVEDGELRGSTRLAAFLRLQRKLASLAPSDGEASVVDELIADRRAEAAREEADEQAWAKARRRRRKPAG